MEKMEVVCFGEILWDYMENGRRLGGAPLNVCYHLSKMGIESRIVSQVGNDKDGNAILSELERLGISSELCTRTDRAPTSTVKVVHDDAGDVSYDIVDDIAWDYINYSEALEEVVKTADMTVFGSLVGRHKTSRDTLLKLLAHSKLKVFDVNLRPPFYDKDYIFFLLQMTDLLKLNMDELYQIGHWMEISSDNYREIIHHLRLRFTNIGEILLTRGERGAVYISEKTVCEVPAHQISVKDTVGSGDSFLAAFLAGRLRGRDVRDSLDKASLLSGYIATRQGACPIYNLKDLEDFKSNNKLSGGCNIIND